MEKVKTFIEEITGQEEECSKTKKWIESNGYFGNNETWCNGV